MKKLFIDVDDKNFQTIVNEIKNKYPWMDVIYDVKVRSITDRKDGELIGIVRELSSKFKGNIFTYINDPFYTVILNGEISDWGLREKCL